MEKKQNKMSIKIEMLKFLKSFVQFWSDWILRKNGSTEVLILEYRHYM